MYVHINTIYRVKVKNENFVKNAQSESCKLSFLWGQNEDCSLGDSISDSSENLL